MAHFETCVAVVVPEVRGCGVCCRVVYVKGLTGGGDSMDIFLLEVGMQRYCQKKRRK